MRFSTCILALGVAAAPLFAQTIPSTINYQGRLTDNTPSQVPVTAMVPMAFAIYDAATAGTQLWLEPATGGTNVSVTNGIFSVALGSTVAIPATVFTGATSTRYLEITLNPGAGNKETLAPRQLLTATGYANLAQNADSATNSSQLGGVAAGQFVQTTDARLSDARAPTAGSSFYIQNGTTAQSAANFNIAGNGAVGGAFTSGGTINAGTATSGTAPAVAFSPSGAQLSANQGGSIELGANNTTASPTGAIPYIDFHYGTGAAQDYNVRLINDANGQLSLYGNLNTAGNLGVTGTTTLSGPISLNGRSPVTASAPMRMLRGQIAATGAIVAGEGFTVSHIAAGVYVINPTVNFGAAPAVTLSYPQPNIGGTPPVIRIVALWGQPAYNAIGVTSFTTAAVMTDTDFDFIAIGPP